MDGYAASAARTYFSELLLSAASQPIPIASWVGKEAADRDILPSVRFNPHPAAMDPIPERTSPA